MAPETLNNAMVGPETVAMPGEAGWGNKNG